jgi:hypothetical protein
MTNAAATEPAYNVRVLVLETLEVSEMVSPAGGLRSAGRSDIQVDTIQLARFEAEVNLDKKVLLLLLAKTDRQTDRQTVSQSVRWVVGGLRVESIKLAFIGQGIGWFGLVGRH